MAVLKYYNTATSAWEYIAASTTANFTTWKKTMAGGETSVSGTDDNGVTLSYTVGLEQVFINGALQARGSDYVATTGTTVTGLSALGANDIVSVVCYAPFNVTNTYTKSETDGVAAAAPGLRLVVPTSVAVGSGSGSANAAGQVSFSGASSVSLNNVFSSTYDNYRIVCDFVGSTTIATYIRLRVAGADNTSSNYNRQYLLANNTSISGGRSTISLWAMTNATSTTRGAYVMDVFNPFLTQVTGAVSQQLGNYNGTSTFALNLEGHGFNTATSFDGFTFFTDTGTASGTISVYGYKD
jgi:hypothetical protein